MSQVTTNINIGDCYLIAQVGSVDLDLGVTRDGSKMQIAREAYEMTVHRLGDTPHNAVWKKMQVRVEAILMQRDLDVMARALAAIKTYDVVNWVDALDVDARIQGTGLRAAWARMAVIEEGDRSLLFTAVTPGTAGNQITVKLVAAGDETPLSVDVDGTEITVNLETDVDGEPVSTVYEVAAAIAADGEASALVTCVARCEGVSPLVPAEEAVLRGGSGEGVETFRLIIRPVGALTDDISWIVWKARVRPECEVVKSWNQEEMFKVIFEGMVEENSSGAVRMLRLGAPTTAEADSWFS